MFDILMALLAGIVAYFALTVNEAEPQIASRPLEGSKVVRPRTPKASRGGKEAATPKPNHGTQISPMMTQLRQSITNEKVRERLLNAEKTKSPHLSEDERIQNILESFFKDRR